MNGTADVTQTTAQLSMTATLPSVRVSVSMTLFRSSLHKARPDTIMEMPGIRKAGAVEISPGQKGRAVRGVRKSRPAMKQMNPTEARIALYREAR